MTGDVAIIGSGIAGAATAIRLARSGYSVALYERRTLPAHKLCGEFLSTEVEAAFRRLGVDRAVREAGAVSISRALVTGARGARFETALPGTALGLSRLALDALLFKAAGEAGATLFPGCAVRDVAGALDQGFALETEDGMHHSRVVIAAHGRRDRLDGRLERPDLGVSSPYVAFKAHFVGVRLPSVIELHAIPGGYCGLNEVEAARINACWIVDSGRLKADGGTPESMIEGTLAQNPALAERMGTLHRVVDSFCSVSQLRFDPRATFHQDICLVGDAAGMIAPLCGDGMAMALYGAELAAAEATRYLSGEQSAEAFRSGYDRAWKRQFRTRMRVGRWLHDGLGRVGLADASIRALRLVPPIGRALVRWTRG